MALLQLEGLTKSFGAVKVADGLDLEIAQGEAVGILGPNGAGKTSVFNLISGTLSADHGKVHFLDKDVTRMSCEARCRAGMGRTYQIPQPFGKMTVFENCLVAATAGGAKSEKESHELCADVLRQMRLLGKANRTAGSLTLLERKALEVARALSSSPRLLLLDEIAGGLTEGEATELGERIRQLHASGTTILWIEHIVHVLLSVVSRLVVLNFGAKMVEGDPAEVMESQIVKQIYMGMGEL
jgi:branched-chain amino acid transport system ATP-binding protein